jgi:flavin reductase (DIM6/NTAB) family NADH-FMN oxidoreductase RutF
MSLVDALKAAMRHYPSGVAIVTTRDPETGLPNGLAASSIISVTMDPPSMLVAINRAGSSHQAIKRAGQFCINLLKRDHQDLVSRFSSPARKDERFTGNEWSERHGLDHVLGTTALFCRTTHSLIVGTHELFVGEVFDVALSTDPSPMGWMNGGFHDVVPSQYPLNAN